MGNIWYNYVRTTVYNALAKHMKTLYPEMFCTTDTKNLSDPSFPTLLLYEIESPLIKDLQGSVVVGMRHYMQLEILTDTTSDECMDIRAEALDFLIENYGYNANLLPVQIDNDVYRGIARIHRVIGGSDKSIVR